MRYEHVPFHTGLLGHSCQAGTYGGRVAGAKVSVNDSETVRPIIDHLLWFQSGEQSDGSEGRRNTRLKSTPRSLEGATLRVV
jgi:hypothetical protein